MRDYARVSSRFWTGETGRRLRGKPNLQIVSMYLITAPNANMIGLYYLPLPIVAHETGLTIEEVSMALHRLRELDVAYYDADSELVFIPAMARYQIGENISGKDNKARTGVERLIAQHAGHPFWTAFMAIYAASYGLNGTISTPSKGSHGLGRTLPKPSKGSLELDLTLRDQDQGKSKDQEQEQAREALAPAEPSPAKLWPAYEWLRKFGLAWSAKYQAVAYGQAGDTIATSRLNDLLVGMADEERIAAQASATRMFVEFMARGDPKHVERRHPWSFFVTDFGGLRVPVAEVGSAKPRDIRVGSVPASSDRPFRKGQVQI